MRAALVGALALLCTASANSATVSGTVNDRDTKTAACPNPSTGWVTSRRRGMVSHEADHPRPINDGAGRRVPCLACIGMDPRERAASVESSVLSSIPFERSEDSRN
jgi:hypothetical protein